jgi:hypothetical protein
VPVELEQLDDVMSRPAGEAAVSHWVMTQRMLQNLRVEGGKMCELVLTPKQIIGVREAFYKRRADELSKEIDVLELQQEQLVQVLAKRRATLSALQSEAAPSAFEDQ